MKYKRIVIPVSGTSCDKRAIELASSVARDSDAELTLVHVVEVAQTLPLEALLPQEVDTGELTLQNAVSWAQSLANGKMPQINPELLQARSAGAAIVNEAIERNAELIVMALQNHRKHGRPTVGETVPYVLKNAPCEVLISRLPRQQDELSCPWPRAETLTE